MLLLGRRLSSRYIDLRLIKGRYGPRNDYSKSTCCCDVNDIRSAAKRIAPYIRHYPLLTSSHFTELFGNKIVFKAENLQSTGSFKIRGAINAVLRLIEEKDRPECLITYSSGNHGQALAKAAQLMDLPCYVVMPEASSSCKIEAVKEYGAEVIFCPDTLNGRDEIGSKVMKDHPGGVFIHPNQNVDVIAGQGTIGLEILELDKDIDTIIAPVGGGGLISGIALAAKSINPDVKIVAAEPEAANDCEMSKQKGEIMPLKEYPDTMADGARINIGSMTWPIIRDHVDDVITVSEDEIKAATMKVFRRLKLVIEPTSGVGVAAGLSTKFRERLGTKSAAVVLCGGNVDMSSFLLSCIS